MRIGLMTDFPSQAVQSGPAIHTRLLSKALAGRGHEVVMIGPDTSALAPMENASRQLFRGSGFPTHPGFQVALPAPLRTLLNPPRIDVVHCQSATHMVHYAFWLREMWRIPLVNTHLVHLPTHAHFVLSDPLYNNPRVRRLTTWAARAAERNFARLYNMGDVLVVQSRFFVEYWRQRGVTVPIEVLGRPIDPDVFARPGDRDPFLPDFPRGKRLLVVCRQDREKGLDQLIRIFTRHLAPADPELSLTLVGDGFEHASLLDQARASGAGRRIHFTGEIPHRRLIDWYTHADLFVYTSLSETVGNVVNEALWCGLPAVALDDRMGVAQQVVDQRNGVLVDPDAPDVDALFAAACLNLCREKKRRRAMSADAIRRSRARSHPTVVFRRLEQIFEAATDHCHATVRTPLSERHSILQWSSFARNISAWGWWNLCGVLGLSHAATRLGNHRGNGPAAHPPSGARRAGR